MGYEDKETESFAFGKSCLDDRRINVLRIGIETMLNYQTVINYIVAIIVFLLFWFMVFYKLTNKHTIRIQGYEEEKQLCKIQL